MKTSAGLLALASLVAGHGFVTNATIGDSSYTFYQPYTDPYTSPVPGRVSRVIQGNGPVTDVASQDVQCGGDTANGFEGSSPAALTATVAAGSTVDLYWTLWPTSHVGPSLTYMAKCANDDCTTFMPESDAVWFKVQENGRTGTSDTWGTTPIMTAGGYISYTIPDCIEAGAYLVRHEVIALHSAYSSGGAQFYPGCHQITVTGGGSTSPSDLVSFPGAYAADDAGILTDVYGAVAYTLPGPALFSCSGSSSTSGSSSSSGSSPAAAVATTVAAVVPATTSVPVNVAAATTDARAADDEVDDEEDDEEGDEACDEVIATSTVSAAQPTATAAVEAENGDAGESEDDDACEDEATTDDTSTGATTDDSSADDEEDCDAEEEQSYARGLSGRYARAM